MSQHPDPRPRDDTDAAQVASGLASVKGEAMNWLRDPDYDHLRLRIGNAHAAVEAVLVEARRRVRLNEGR